MREGKPFSAKSFSPLALSLYKNKNILLKGLAREKTFLGKKFLLPRAPSLQKLFAFGYIVFFIG